MTGLLIVFGGGMLALIVLAVALIGGPSEAKAKQRRLEAVRFRHSGDRDTQVETRMKRAIAARARGGRSLGGDSSRIAELAVRLRRAGSDLTTNQYIYISAGIGVVVAALVLLQSHAPFLALIVGLVAGLGLPHAYINRRIARRTQEFNNRFADAIELLVRGLRAGLPVSETFGVVAQEIPGPVGQEFKAIMERVRVGRTMDESLQRTADRLGIPEFNFFCISIAIQRETGGNLAETLSNLADVLRKRAQMKLKIRAMSSESKASAYIVGALPFLVFGLIAWMNPEYVSGFFSEDRLIIAGLGGLVWMGIGVFIMAKMVSFEI